MLEKTKVLLITVPIALCAFSCTKVQTIQPKAESPQVAISAATSPNATKPRIILNVGDLNDIDKLLLQVNRANQVDKDLVAGGLKSNKNYMEKDWPEGLHGGRSGVTKLFCDSPLYYPTVDGLVGCAKATSLDQGNFEAKLRGFKGSSKLYRTALLFSDRTNTPLPAAERQKIEKNIACLDAFVKTPNPKTPGCELVKVALLNPNLPGGKILPSPPKKQ